MASSVYITLKNTLITNQTALEFATVLMASNLNSDFLTKAISFSVARGYIMAEYMKEDSKKANTTAQAS